jgi:DNA-binding XRE family transcriptional regulator
MDLRLYQREAAERIGVSESTIWNWERGVEPELRFIPKIIAFLGYSPFPRPHDLLERLRHFKFVQGLSYIRLGKLMQRDPEQLTDWLTGRKRPCKKNVRKIESFLVKADD